MDGRFYDHLKKIIMGEFVYLIYKETKNFPKERVARSNFTNKNNNFIDDIKLYRWFY